MDVSVVIPSYNTEDTLEETLRHLSHQQTDAEYEVIVVDCSAHDKVKAICAKFNLVRFFSEAERFNPGEGRNIGARHAHGKLVVFIDADVVLEDGALNAAWLRFKNGHQIFGGALELNVKTSVGVSSYLEHYFFNHESQPRRPQCERKNLSSALMCFDRQLFLDSGGFKDIPRMQDTELTERLKAEGHALWFFPQILGYQTQDSPLNKVLKKVRINGQNLYYIRYKQPGNKRRKATLAVLLPFITAAKLLRIVWRHLRYQPIKNKAYTLLLSPVLAFASFYWMLGFYQAMIHETGIGKER